MNTLTYNQEKFCQVYIQTGNQSEAYRQAYPKSLKWKPESVNVKASEMMTNVKVSARVKELQNKLEKKHDISKDKIIARLQEIIYKQEELGVDKIDLPAMNKAIDTLNKMQGYYAPEKVEHSGELTINSIASRLIGK